MSAIGRPAPDGGEGRLLERNRRYPSQNPHRPGTDLPYGRLAEHERPPRFRCCSRS